MYMVFTMLWEFDILAHLILRLALGGRNHHPNLQMTKRDRARVTCQDYTAVLGSLAPVCVPKHRGHVSRHEKRAGHESEAWALYRSASGLGR